MSIDTRRTLEVVTEGADIAAVPLAGAGRQAVERLKTVTGVQRLLRLLEAGEMLDYAGFTADNTRLISIFVSWLTGAGSDHLQAVLGEPAMSAWISRIGLHAKMLIGSRGHPALRIRIEREMGQLPVLLLGLLDSLNLRGRSLTVWIDGGFRTAPVGLEWQFRAPGRGWRPYQLKIKRGCAMLSDAEGIVAEVDLSDGPCNASIITHKPERICVEPRRRLSKYCIELLRSSAYPELAGMRLPEERTSRLSDRVLDDAVGGAIDVIARVWPESVHDVGMVGGVLPMSMPDTRWNSASTDDLPFVLQLTVQPDAPEELLAESVIHEASHVKLDAAHVLDELLRNPIEDKSYFHPWRPDPRPLFGVLYGAHAFLAVAMLWRQILRAAPNHPFADREFQLRHREVGEAMQTLSKHADFTHLGRIVFDVMSEGHAALG